jgi:cysteine desulfurase
MEPLYLDHAATTPLHPKVLQRMMPYFLDQFGNPSSLHRFGQVARSAITESRDLIASLLGASPRSVIFTSGGTESDNLAIFGIAAGHPDKKHIVTTTIEHHAVLHACDRLESLGYSVTRVSVDDRGYIRMEELERAIRSDTLMVSVMYANNEVGTIQPIEAIAQLTTQCDVLLHVDAVQAIGKLPIDFQKSGIDLMTVSAHKLNGPKGVGALICSPQALAKLVPTVYGGSQERKRRAGTENVPGIVGFAAALQLSINDLVQNQRHYSLLRKRMLERFEALLPHGSFVINGHPDQHLAHILNVSFPGLSTETLLMNADLAGIAASSGSACTSGSHELSHVLLAMKRSKEVASSAIRFSFGYGQSEQQIVEAAEKIATIVNRLRNTQ